MLRHAVDLVTEAGVAVGSLEVSVHALLVIKRALAPSNAREVKIKKIFQGEEPLDTGGGRVFFSLDASSGLLATRRRLGRRGDSSALRSAFVV